MSMNFLSVPCKKEEFFGFLPFALFYESAGGTESAKKRASPAGTPVT